MALSNPTAGVAYSNIRRVGRPLSCIESVFNGKSVHRWLTGDSLWSYSAYAPDACASDVQMLYFANTSKRRNAHRFVIKYADYLPLLEKSNRLVLPPVHSDIAVDRPTEIVREQVSLCVFLPEAICRSRLDKYRRRN